MNAKLKSLFGVGFAGFIALFALHGKAFIDALAGFPGLFSAWSAGLPLGVWSTLLAVAIATGAWAFLMRWLPKAPAGHPPGLAADTMSILVGIAVTTAQQFVAEDVRAGAVLNAIWMGIAAGFLAQYLGRVLRSLFAKPSPPPLPPPAILGRSPPREPPK